MIGKAKYITQGVKLPIAGEPFNPMQARPWQLDPLLPAVARFVAARPFTGSGALMRRYGIGLQRARWLLIKLEDRGVVRGHWSRLVARGSIGERAVYAFRIYRVRPWVWAELQGGGQ